MKTLLDARRRGTGARLARIGFGRGREALYRDQLPALIEALAEATRIESITARRRPRHRQDCHTAYPRSVVVPDHVPTGKPRRTARIGHIVGESAG